MDVNIDSVRTVDLTIEKRPQVSRMEIVDSGRRRRFTDEAKLAIVAESYNGPRQERWLGLSEQFWAFR